jgi:2-polyprenyl-6-hydroxyphenyl methylase / 3-demethylubiquinone-9 3-methyltransferase
VSLGRGHSSDRLGPLTLPLVVSGTHTWSKFIQPQEIARATLSNGLKVADVSGMIYNPVSGAWTLNTLDIDVNYIVHATHDTPRPVEEKIK